MIGGPALYNQADAAATSAYNSARGSGLSPDAARQASYEGYLNYLKQGRGTARFPFNKPMNSAEVGGAEVATGKGGTTVKMDVGTGGLTGSGDP